MREHTENFNRERENTRKYQTEATTELKNTLTNGINLDELENLSASQSSHLKVCIRSYHTASLWGLKGLSRTNHFEHYLTSKMPDKL